MRRFAAVAALALATLGAGCGGGGKAGGGLDDSLRYYSADSVGVAVVSTDLGSDQFRELDRIVLSRTHRSVESWLRRSVEDESDLSWERDVKPLLGNEVVVGALPGQQLVGVFHAADGGKLRDVVEKEKSVHARGKIDGIPIYVDRGGVFALDGDRLVGADNESTLRRALDERDRDDHLTEARFEARLADLPANALARGYVSVEVLGLLPQLAQLRAVPWIDALQSVGAAVSFRNRRAIVDLSLNTDASRISDRDLPFATGDEAPEVFRRDSEIVGGNRDQSVTTVFLWHAAEALFPDSGFVTDVHSLEHEFGIDFADEILRQFDGPSASAVSLDGKQFAARSKVHDPGRLRDEIRKIAPRLPRIVQALAPLRSQGQALLFLLAPDVIVGGSSDGIHVTPPATPDGLYHVTGLTGPGPAELWFGVIGDSFVVASDETTARGVADEQTYSVPGAHGAGVLRVDLTGQDAAVERSLGFGVGPLGEVVAWAKASREHVRAHVAVEVK